jgi:hypothetical protein
MARMKGYIDKYYQPKIRLKAKGLRRTIELDAVIDTGFDGELCLPLPIAIQLELELGGNQYAEFADGTVKHELIFAGKVILEDKEIPVDISLTNWFSWYWIADEQKVNNQFSRKSDFDRRYLIFCIDQFIQFFFVKMNS